MTKAIKARLDALRSKAGSDEGFTLIELMVAVGILATALILMAYTSMAALSYTALSRQRQGADGLAGQVMEQIRALPFSALQAGLGNADLANSVIIGNAAYDPNITLNTCGVPIVYCYQGEQIPRGNNVAALPLVPHQQTVTSGPTTYVIDVYITFYQNEQTSAVQGIAQTSGAELTLSGQPTQTVGEAKNTSAADNDPGHPGGDFQASSPYPLIGPGAGSLSATGSQNTITLTSSASDVYA